MSHKYEYDTKGNVTSYLLLTILLPIITVLLFRRSPKTCNCVHHKKIKPTNNYKYTILLLILVAYLGYRVVNAKFEVPQSPYTILGIEDTASKTEVKRAYKKLIIKFNPDRNKNIKECTEKLFDINSAYNQISQGIKIKSTILNETVAIPQFIVEQKYPCMILYFAFLLVFVYVGVKLWRRNMKKNIYGIDYGTVDIFYKKIEDVMARDADCIVRNIVILMSESIEYNTTKKRVNNWVKKTLLSDRKITEPENILSNANEDSQKNEKVSSIISTQSKIQKNKKSGIINKKNVIKDPVQKFVKNNIESKFAYPIRDCSPGFYILMDHLFRTNVYKTEDRIEIAQKSLGMVAVMKRIAIAKNLHDILNSLFMVQRMITQAVFEPAYSALQFPSVEFEDVFLKRKSIDETEIMLPRIKIIKLFSYVASNEASSDENSSCEEVEEDGEKKENNNSKNTVLTIKAVLSQDITNKNSSDDAFFVKTKGEIDYDLINAMGKSKKTIVHSPFIKNESTLVWEAIFTFKGEIKKTYSFSDFYGTKELMFEMSNEKGKLELEIKNGQYFGCDIKGMIVL